MHAATAQVPRFPRFRGVLVAALRLAAIVFAALLAGPARAAEAEAGGAPPRDGWVTEGGCAARTANGSARALDGPVETAWTQTLPGALGGEPLVTGSFVVLDVGAPAGQRTLSVHQVADGRQVAKRQIRTAEPLLPSLVGSLVVVRLAPTRIGAYRLKGTQLVEAWNVDVGEPVESLVAAGAEAYVRTSRSVARYDLGARQPRWRTGTSPSGRLALRGEHVYVVETDGDEGAHLVALDRTNGATSARVELGHASGAALHGRGPTIQVHERFVSVLLDRGIATTSGGAANGIVVARRAAGPTVRLSDSKLFLSRSEAIGSGDRWMLPMVDDEEAAILFWGKADADGGQVLATRKRHAEWLGGAERASVSSGVVYHPAGALELASSRVLWKPDRDWIFRPVPTRGLLLVAEAGNVLRALRETGSRGAESGPAAVAGGLPDAGADGRAVLRDGTVASGRIRRAPEGFVVDGKPPRPLAAADVLLVEDAGGRVLHAVAGDELAAALDALADEQVGAAAGKALAEILPSRDAALLERVYAEAVLRGAPPADLEKAEKRIRDLTRPGKPLPADPAAAERAAKALADAAKIPATLAAARLRALPADAPGDVVVDLLRIVLRDDPAQPEAVARVKAMLPEGVTPPEPFDAREWLDFVEAVRHTPVRVVKPVPANTPNMTKAQRAVGVQSVLWRRDVIGLESRQLLIVTPLARPGAIARCLSLGELVCATLEGWFEAGTRKRATQDPLLLLLYPTEEDYARDSAKRGGFDTSWTAGHYSPSEELSRLFLPEDDDAFQQVIGVFAHELTHQWVDERCPYFAASERKETVRTPGYWVVEGFATFVEHLSLDPRRRTWQLDPANESLETVAVAERGQLVPWKTLLAIDQGTFAGISREPEFKLPFVRRLGWNKVLSRTHVFYEQSAALCCYLFHAEGGRHRQQLLDYVAARACGRPPPPEEAFGLSADELGARVVKWARETVAGAK